MKVKLDENLPSRLVSALTDLGHQVDTVVAEDLAGSEDPVIWEAAQKAKRFLITQDLDFSDARRFRPGTHVGLLLVRLRAPGRRALQARVQAAFQTEDVTSWSRCLVVLSDHKIRVRRPQPQ